MRCRPVQGDDVTVSRIAFGALLICLAVVTAAAAGPEHVVKVQRIEDRKAVLATIASTDTTAARARIGGTIKSLTVDEGDRVKSGELLATVDDAKLPLKLAALEAQIASLDAEQALARIELDRAQKLRARGSGTQARLDQTRTNIRVVDSRLAAARAERGVVAAQMEEGSVLAPDSGRVLRVHVTKGAVVLPGEPVATIALDQYVIRLELPERHARHLKEGDRILVGARGLTKAGEGLRPGTIQQVYPELDNGRVIADAVAEGIGDFFVGERTRVYVATGSREAILIPAAYLSRRYGLTFVRVKGVGEIVVQTGESRGGEVEILSGLVAGDVLVAP